MHDDGLDLVVGGVAGDDGVDVVTACDVDEEAVAGVAGSGFAGAGIVPGGGLEREA